MGRKEELLEAAERVFVKFGIEKTTLDDIASELGLKKTAVYYYFKSKNDLLAKMITSKIDRIIAGQEEAVLAAKGLKNKIKAFMEYKTDILNNNDKLGKMLEDGSYPKDVINFMNSMKLKMMEGDYMVLYRAIEKSIDHDVIAVEKIDSLILMIMGVTYGGIVGRYFHDTEWDLSSLADDSIDIIFKGIERDRSFDEE